MIDSIRAATDALRAGAEARSEALFLQLGACRLAFRSNSPALVRELAAYFDHVRCTAGPSDLEVLAIERDAPELTVGFVDWARELGKSGRKDATFDLPGGRLILKVRTGMVFLQSPTACIAAGPCLRHPNQVINFINAQYMSWLQQRGWLLCHAAGLVRNGRALGLAGFSGGGKSTLMLNLLEDDGAAYLTNDRLLLRRTGDDVVAAGIPKQPRINPGTLVHNPRLRHLIPPERRARLLELPPAELWALEEKHDVMVPEVYGPARVAQSAPLAAFVVLAWRRESDAPVALERVDLAARPDLLAAIMKSPGPFYQHSDGAFHRDDASLPADEYLAALTGVPVWAATGTVDFAGLAQLMAARELLP